MASAAISVNAALPDAEMRCAVEEDWTRQEKRWGRAAGSVESIREAVARITRLLKHWRGRTGEATLAELRRAAEKAGLLDNKSRLALYHRARWFARELVLADPRVTGQPLVFMKRNRFVCQMLHEYMGYFQDYGNVAGGGGVFVLERPGYSLKTRDLIRGRLTNGNFTTLALSYDARTVFFAFAERSKEKPEFTSLERRSFHIFSMARDGSALRQLTRGVEDDFDPCPLPDGGLAFMSSRRGGFARCNNAWEPCATYTLHRMDANGSNIRTLSFHETDEWHPFVMNDGRLVFIRWDYVDRSAANFHGLWTSRADGTGAASLFGNYTMRINACYQPRPIPGSDKLLFLAGAHHADVGGSLVMLDPKRARLDAKTGEDILDATYVLTPEICFPESAGWPKSYFHSPWPLSEDAFLVSFSFDPLPGMSSGEKKDTRTGLYYFDRFGNLELLYRDPAISSMYPISLAPRARPPAVGSNLAPELGNEGEFLLSDVNRSLMPLPPDRPIRELRVFQLLPKTGIHTANNPRIGHANAENARLFLGTVPVEEDGSAYFRAPAGKPLYFQAVDAAGRAVQSMRSEVYLQPGERRACVGCHETPGTVVANRPALAMRRAPSRLQPGPDGTRPMSYPRLVQPVLDRHCVRCHDGQPAPGKSKLVLTGETAGNFTRSYQNLKPHLRWYEWGGASISQIATQPGRIGADASPLTAILDDATHRTQAPLPDADRRRLYLWLDANVPFYGTYDHADQLAQREGRSVPVPLAQ
ncbi:MAG: hypothetical protein HZC54_05870 [Verrucomicrobia bacterium]|nr:hypothetical protein [Verrucomicrobiota bacterium]